MSGDRPAHRMNRVSPDRGNRSCRHASSIAQSAQAAEAVSTTAHGDGGSGYRHWALAPKLLPVVPQYCRNSQPTKEVQSMSTIPTIELNDGTRIPQLGFGVFQIDPDKTAQSVQDGAGHRLPPHRYRGDVPERGRRRAGHPRRRPRSRRGVHHQQAQQRLPQARRRATRVRRDAREARLRLCRPVPHPLAAADALRWRLRLDMANPRGVQEGRTRPQHRCVQLPGRPLGAAGTRNRRPRQL